MCTICNSERCNDVDQKKMFSQSRIDLNENDSCLYKYIYSSIQNDIIQIQNNVQKLKGSTIFVKMHFSSIVPYSRALYILAYHFNRKIEIFCVSSLSKFPVLERVLALHMLDSFSKAPRSG